MAFCTTCGATVQGAFCQQCGTPSSAAAAPAAAPQPQQQAAPMAFAPVVAAPVVAAPVATAPVTGKVSPIVWILLTVLGLIVLSFVGCGVFAMYMAHTVVSNPGLVLGKIITASNPDAEVVATDPSSQTMRIRDRKTGEEVTLSFDDIKKGKLTFSAKGKNGEVANMEIGGGEGKLPSWVPTYPGAKAQGNMTARGEGADGAGEGGVVTFTTPDPPSKVMAFYEAKIKDMGMTINLTGTSDAGGLVAGVDEGG